MKWCHWCVRKKYVKKLLILNYCLNFSAPKSCPEGYLYYEKLGQCYKVSRDNLNWSTARLKCQNLGADLATIGSIELQDFVVDMAGYFYLFIYIYTCMITQNRNLYININLLSSRILNNTRCC